MQFFWAVCWNFSFQFSFMIRIGIDMMGGDFAPLEAVKGAAAYLESDRSDVMLQLIGDEAQIKPLLSQFSIPLERVEMIHCSQSIGMHEHPTKALKEKTDSSISKGFALLA